MAHVLCLREEDEEEERENVLSTTYTYVRTPRVRPLELLSERRARFLGLRHRCALGFWDPLPHRRARAAYVRANLPKTRTSGFKEAAAAGDRSSSRDPTPERATPAWLWREPGAPMSDECDGARPPRATLGWGLGRRDNHLLLW